MFPIGSQVLYEGEWWIVESTEDYSFLGTLYVIHDPNLEVRARFVWEDKLREDNLTPQEKLGGVG